MSFPINMLPEAGTTLVVGGGRIALRKAQSLSRAGFSIMVVAPEVLDQISGMGGVVVKRDRFKPDDIQDKAMVFACTNDREVNREVGVLCRAQRIPVLVADSQSESTFFCPAVYASRDLSIAVSTEGASPRLAKEIRDSIATGVRSRWKDRLAEARRERDRRDDGA